MENPEHKNSKGEVINFHTSTDPKEDRVHSLRIIKEGEKLGDGIFSKSVRVVEAAALDKDETESPPHNFVLKEFKFPAEWDWSKGKPGENALKIFNDLREKGLRTWTTYRLNDEGDKVIMTNGNLDGQTVLTANRNLSEAALALESHPIREIKNFQQFMEDLFKEAKKAENEKIYIHADAYGFFIENTALDSGISNLDFVIADMDRIEMGESESRQYEINLGQAFQAMQFILPRYVETSKAHDYLRQASSYLRSEYGFSPYEGYMPYR